MQPNSNALAGGTLTLPTRWVIILVAVLVAVFISLALLALHKSGAGGNQSEISALRLSQALSDSVRSVNENGQLRREKLTLQGSIRQLEAESAALNAQQQELLATVKRYQAQPKGPRLIAAGSIRSRAALRHPQPWLAADTLSRSESGKSVAETRPDTTSLTFTFASDTLNYRAQVRGLRAVPGQVPALQLQSLNLPNEATVAFTWDEAHAGHPVSFAVTNSNPLFRVAGLESYAIPELRPEILKPHGWPKLWKGLGHGLRTLVPIGLGVLAGFTAGVLLVH